MPRMNVYRIDVFLLGVWMPSNNFIHRVNGPRFKSRIAAQHALKKYGSLCLRAQARYRIVPERKPKKL